MFRESGVLRDFVYLDWERVRSLAAQLFHGVPEDVSTEKGHQLGGEGQLGGSALGLLKGQVQADYRYFRTENETRSFHHHVYSLVEGQLTSEGLITEVNQGFDFNQWSEAFFCDAQFILVKGLVRLMDFAWISAMMEGLPKMMQAAQHAETFSLKQQRDGGQITQKDFDKHKRAQQKDLASIRELKLTQITGLVSGLYGDVVRVKLLPSKIHPDKVFVGSGNPECFQDTAASLSQKYGYDIDADWQSLGQINTSAISDKPLPLPVGNAMEDAFERVAFSINDIIRIASAAKFPAVSFTPISIYRTCRREKENGT